MSEDDRVFFMPRHEDLFMGVSSSMSLDIPDVAPIDYIVSARMGGLVNRRPERVITLDTPPERHGLVLGAHLDRSGVQAMLEDGWVIVERGDRIGDMVKTDARPAGPPIIVPVEGDVCGGVYMRTGPPGDLRIGHTLGHDAGGEAVLCPRLEWVDKLARPGMGWVSERAVPGSTVRISAARIDSGRYAERLPTNRQRKRARCKARRRARIAAATL